MDYKVPRISVAYVKMKQWHIMYRTGHLRIEVYRGLQTAVSSLSFDGRDIPPSCIKVERVFLKPPYWISRLCSNCCSNPVKIKTVGLLIL